MFEKMFKISSLLFLINMIFVAIKDIVLGGETTRAGNNLLVIITIIFTISMLITSFYYIKNRKSDSSKNYKGLYYTVLIFMAIVWILVGYYVFSPFPELLSHTNT